MESYYLSEAVYNEAYKSRKKGCVIPERKDRRLRGVPDVLPVGVQDVLHRRQSELPKRQAVRLRIKSAMTGFGQFRYNRNDLEKG